LARHERSFGSGEQEALSLNELLAMLGNAGEGEAQSREDAIACYLSGGDGWSEAAKLLGGTFAESVAELRRRKDD
jgi:hypothetical protein